MAYVITYGRMWPPKQEKVTYLLGLEFCLRQLVCLDAQVMFAGTGFSTLPTAEHDLISTHLGSAVIPEGPPFQYSRVEHSMLHLEQ